MQVHTSTDQEHLHSLTQQIYTLYTYIYIYMCLRVSVYII